MEGKDLWEDDNNCSEYEEEYEDNDDENFVKTMVNFRLENIERSKVLIHKYLYISKIKTGDEVLTLLEELKNDKSEYVCLFNIILDAFKEETLYWLQVEKNEETWPGYYNKRDDSSSDEDDRDTVSMDDLDDTFLIKGVYGLKTDWNTLPCFCIVNKEDRTICDLIWVHSRARKNGFGRRMIELLGIKYVEATTEESSVFWDKIGRSNIKFRSISHVRI